MQQYVDDLRIGDDGKAPAARYLLRRLVDRAALLAYACRDGVNIIQNNGRAAWQTVFHYHVHVVPRWKDDPIELPWIPRPGDPDFTGVAQVGRSLDATDLIG